MKLSIIGKPYAIAEVDLIRLKENLSIEWNLETSIKSSTTIKEKGGTTSDDILKQLIWLGLDWGTLIDEFYRTPSVKMTVHFYTVKYKDWVKFYPGKTEESNREITLIEKKEDGETTLLIQSLIPYHNFGIKQLIKRDQFNYATKGGGVE